MIYVLDENKNPIKLKEAPYQGGNLYFTLLDFTDINDVDIVCFPLNVYEIFTTSVAEIRIGNLGFVYVPLDYHVPVGDRFHGDLELLDILSIIDKEIETLVIKPIDGYHIRWETIDVINIYEDVSYIFPVVRNTHLVACPIENVHNPYCIFVGNRTVKQNVILDPSFFMK